ncbi:hypothetical protein [Streptomyces malaysiensis]|nr:hypothetical protein [Streptomyces malaysiensis]
MPLTEHSETAELADDDLPRRAGLVGYGGADTPRATAELRADR